MGVAGEGVLQGSSWSSLAIVSGSEGNESLSEKWCAGENETGGRKELIGEFRESSERIAEGFAGSEESRGVQRHPEKSCMPCFQRRRGAKTGAGQRHKYFLYWILLFNLLVELLISRVSRLGRCSVHSGRKLIRANITHKYT